MGMSTPMNEIARLCRITPPDVAVELNVLPVHIEHLGSIERIQQAKAELVEGMKIGGVAVLNADDPRVAAMEPLSKGRTITYGIANAADVRAETQPTRTPRLSELFRSGSSDVKAPLLRNSGSASTAASAVFDMRANSRAISAGLKSPISRTMRIIFRVK